MSREYLESVLKEIHKDEIDRSYKLDGAINLPTAIVTVLLGVGSFYLEHLPEIKGRSLAIVFYVMMVLFFACLIATMVCLLLSYFRYRYRMLSDPKEIFAFDEGLREHYDPEKYDVAIPEGTTLDEQVKKEVRENLIGQYLESAAQNRVRNLQRTDWLYRSTYYLVGSLSFLMISRALFYVVNDTTPKPQEVKITEVPGNQRISVALPDVQKVDVVGVPKIDVVRTPAPQKVEIVGQPPARKVEIVIPRKGDQ
jgi:hypothetical protein